VFIKMNTSSVRLSAFDIVVAQFEEATGKSLHDLVDEVHSSVPGLSHYRRIEDVVLDVAALRADRPPTQASYQRLDLNEVAAQWDEIIAGLQWAVDFLEEEKVFDGERLPSVAVLPVLAALAPVLPAALDELGNARSTLRSYIWRAFLTARYEQSAGTRALQDYRGLRSIIAGGDEAPPIFDDEFYPPPGTEELIRAGWPKTREILARGVLAMSLRAGGSDLADGTPASVASVTRREYHHLFPDSLLQNKAGLQRHESFKALNCALITWNTNRDISAKTPLRYLRERAERTTLGDSAAEDRLATHLIPYDELAEAGFDDATEDQVAAEIELSYRRFLNARAELLATYATALCQGAEV